MRLRRLIPSFLLSLVALFTLPSVADPSDSPHLRTDILYTRQGELVQVRPMHALTLDAHVDAFQYEPLGIEIAYAGSETEGNQVTYFVKVVVAASGREMEQLSFTAPVGRGPDGDDYGYELLGWSPSGRYLMLERFAPAPVSAPGDPAAGKTLHEFLRWDISAAVPEARIIPLESVLPNGPYSDFTVNYISPNKRWIAFEQYYDSPSPSGTIERRHLVALYDTEGDTLRPLMLPEDAQAWDWQDNTHLRLLERSPGQGPQFASYDIVSDKTTPIPRPTISEEAGRPKAQMSKRYPDLALDVEHRPLLDLQKSGGRIDSHIVWIRRTPLGKLPLGVVAAGLTPGEEDPQAVWSPTGQQVAFLAHGDLYLTDLVAPDLIADEKAALGLPLTCPEEGQLARSNLQQLGLALMQYTQDYDETFPPGDNIDERIYPYVKTHNLYSVGTNHWVYQQPPSLSLAKIDAPAQLVVGTLDTPCAHNVLYADGHVHSFAKPEAVP